MASWLHCWYDLYARPNIRQTTAERYRLMMDTYTIPRIGDIKLVNLTSRDLQQLYKELMESGRVNRKSGQGNPGLSTTTVHSVHLMLHTALERAVKEHLILRNPADDCIPPKIQRKEMQILPPEHMKAYLDAADRRGLLAMFYLELTTGVRKGELVALRWSDVDVANRTIFVSRQYIKNPSGELTLSRTKTETSVRKISIPQEAVDLLIAEHAKHPYASCLFPSPVTGGMYHPDSIVKDTILSAYKKLFEKDAAVEAVHAGIECGLFADSIPHLDCVSIGPDMGDVHTPREHLSIASSQRTYELLKLVLAESK